MSNIIAAIEAAALGVHRSNGQETLDYKSGDLDSIEILAVVSAYQPLVMAMGNYSQKELSVFIEAEGSQFTQSILKGDTFTRSDGTILTVQPRADATPFVLPVGLGTMLSIHTTTPIKGVTP
jgi:hypothetical protein